MELIKSTFGGTITLSGKTVYAWRISFLENLVNVIIPHFDKFPLITQKRSDFELFKRAVEMMSRQEHLTLEGVQQIVNLKATLNKGLSKKLKLAFPNTKPATRPSFPFSKIPSEYWLCGFVDGEGNFMVMTNKNLSHKSGTQIVLRFKVTQHVRDAKLIKSFVDFFGCGDSYTNKDCEDFIVAKFSNITNIILPFFNEHPLLGCKALDLADFRRVAEMMQNKEHLTEEGLDIILRIKEGINRGRRSGN